MKYRIQKPEDLDQFPFWAEEMDYLNGTEVELDNEYDFYIAGKYRSDVHEVFNLDHYVFNREWITPVE